METVPQHPPQFFTHAERLRPDAFSSGANLKINLPPLKLPPLGLNVLNSAFPLPSPRSATIIDALLGLSERPPLPPPASPPTKLLTAPFGASTPTEIVASAPTTLPRSEPATTEVPPSPAVRKWKNVSLNHVKGPWQKEDDEVLKELVDKQGPRDWSRIAANIPGRTGKQCRDRWINHLAPDIKKTPWTAQEDQLLIEVQRELGNAWSKIAQMLPGRPYTAVKNRWYGSLRHQVERDPAAPQRPSSGSESSGEARAASSNAPTGGHQQAPTAAAHTTATLILQQQHFMQSQQHQQQPQQQLQQQYKQQLQQQPQHSPQQQQHPLSTLTHSMPAASPTTSQQLAHNQSFKLELDTSAAKRTKL